MIRKILLGLAFILIPNISYAAIVTTWNSTSTTQGWTSPTRLTPTGVDQTVVANNFIGTSTATSTFAGGIKSPCFSADGLTCLGSSTSITGTTGQVVYLNGTNSAIGTSSIFIDSMSEVGIGTTTPISKLQVYGNASGSKVAVTVVNAANPVFGQSAILRLAPSSSYLGFESNAPYIEGLYDGGTASNGGLAFGTFSSSLNERMRITSGGIVGIGTTSPSQALSVQGGGLFSGNLSAANLNATGTATIGGNIGVGGAAASVLNITLPNSGRVGIDVNNYIQFGPSSAATWVTNGTAAFSLNSSQTAFFAGNVGIGTTTPSTSLQVFKGSNVDPVVGGLPNGVASFFTTGHIGIDVGGNFAGGSYAWIQSRDDRPASAYNLALQPAGGNVGIGTTTPGTGFGTTKFDVIGSGITTRNFGSSGFGQLNVFNDLEQGFDIYALGSTFGGTSFGGVSGSNQVVMEGKAGVSSMYIGNQSSVPLIFATGRNERMRVDGNGNIGIGSSTPNQKFVVQGSQRLSGIVNGSGIFADNGTAAGIFSFTRQDAVNTGDLSVAAFGGIGFTGGSQAYNNAGFSNYPMYLTSGGFLGLGSTSPFGMFSIHHPYNGANVPLFVIASSTANSTTTLFSVSNTGSTTAANGFNITAGCYAISGTCITGGGGGSGTVNSGTTGQTAYYAANGTAVTGTSTVFISTASNVGIGTTSPSQVLSVQGNQIVSGTSTVGNLYATSTATIGSLSAGGLVKSTAGLLSLATAGVDYSNFAYPFSLATNFGSINQATTGIAWFQNSLNASSTSHFDYGNANAFVLNSTSSPAYQAGKLVFDTRTDSLTFFNSDSNVSLQVGQEEWIKVFNNTGSTIPNGSAVYISGTTGVTPTVGLAQANAAATTIVTGLATEDIANNATGTVTTIGVVNGLNTTAFAPGATLFLSTTTPGGLVPYAGTSPNYRYRVGIVASVNATTGSIHVTPSTAAIGNGAPYSTLQINAAGSQTFSNDLLVTGSTTIMNLKAINATSTNATTTNFFATNASTTNATSTNFFAVNASTTNLTATTITIPKYGTAAGQFTAWDASGNLIPTTTPSTSAATTEKSLIVAPSFPIKGDGVGMPLTGNTTAHVAQVFIPFGMTANLLTYQINAVSVAGTLKFGLYSENGQTQYFGVTTGTISAVGSGTSSVAISSAVIPAGLAYLVVVPTGTTNVTSINYTEMGNAADPLYKIGGKPMLDGTLTVTAGTLPTTFTPSAITPSTGNAIVVRLDN